MTLIEKDCIVEHEGRTHEAGGAVVTPTEIVAYPSDRKRNPTDWAYVLTDWHGNDIGLWCSVAKWPVRPFLSDCMHQIVAKVDGVYYTGRGLGEGCIFRGKRKAKQSW